MDRPNLRSNGASPRPYRGRMQVMQSYRSYYESKSYGEELTDREKLRIASIVDGVPRDVRTILEVGCGDGRIASF